MSDNAWLDAYPAVDAAPATNSLAWLNDYPAVKDVPDTRDARDIRAGVAAPVAETQESAPAAAKGSFGGRIGDVAVDSAKAVIGWGDGVLGLASMATGGIAGDGWRAMGYDPEEAKKVLSTLYSDKRLQEEGQYNQAKGVGDTLSALADNPLMTMGKAVETLAPMLGGMAAAGEFVATKFVAAKNAAMTGGATEAAAIEAAKAAVKGLGTKAVAASEGLQQAGTSFSQQQGDEIDLAKNYLSSIASGLGTAAIGFGAGKLGSKIGLGDVEGAVASRLGGVGGEAGMTLGGVAKSVPKGIVQEGFLEEAPQSYQENAWSNYAHGRPLNEGAAKAVTTGAVLGGIMGGGVNLAATGTDYLSPPPATPSPQAVVQTILAASDIDAAIDTAATLLNESPEIRTPGSFGAMNEFADLLNDERADVERRRTAIADEQSQAEFDALRKQEEIDVAIRRNQITPAIPTADELFQQHEIERAQTPEQREAIFNATPEAPQTAIQIAMQEARRKAAKSKGSDNGSTGLINTAIAAQGSPSESPVVAGSSNNVGIDGDTGGSGLGGAAIISGPSDGQAVAVSADQPQDVNQPQGTANVATPDQAEQVKPKAQAETPAAAVAAKAPVEESTQERSEREFGENYDRVQQDINGSSTKDLYRAVLFADKAIQRLNLKAQRGEPYNKDFRNSLIVERDYLKGEWAKREDRFEQSAAGITQGVTSADSANTPPIDLGQAATAVESNRNGEVIQNRDRSSKASVLQMQSIANNPDPSRLSFSRDMTSGAPVVAGDIPANSPTGKTDTIVTASGRKIEVQYRAVEGADLVASHNADGTAVADYADPAKIRAIAGNGRLAGIQSAYKMGKAKNYKAGVAADESLHGVPAAEIAKMKRPVLVRVMKRSDITANIGDESNIQQGAALDAIEQAKTDIRRVNLESLEFNDDGNVSVDALRRFVQSMPTTEQAGLIDKSGSPSQAAEDRLIAAVFHQAYGDDALTELAAQARDPEAKVIINALTRAAPAMMKLEGALDLDIRGAVRDAARLAVTARRNGVKLDVWLSQGDFELTQDARIVAGMFVRNARSTKAITEKLIAAAEFAYNEATKAGFDMFGAVQKASRAQVLGGLDDTTGTQNLEQQGGRQPNVGNDGRQANERPGQDAGENAGQVEQARPELNLEAESNDEIAARLEREAEAKRQRAAEDAKAARDERNAKDKAEKDRRAAEIIAEDKARRDAEVAALQNPDDFVFGANAPKAPDPVIKKVSTEQARGQGDVFAQPDQEPRNATPVAGNGSPAQESSDGEVANSPDGVAPDNPRMIGSGDVLYSESGRKLSPAPKLGKRTASNIKNLNAWLLDEARKEAEANGNDWQVTLLKGIDATKMQQPDQDTVNEVLFGDPDGPQAKHRAPHDGKVETPAAAKSILKPLVPPVGAGDTPVNDVALIEPHVTNLSAADQQALAEHYGEDIGSAAYFAKIKADVIAFANKGAEAVSKAIRHLIAQIHAGVISVAMIFNPNFTADTRIVVGNPSDYVTRAPASLALASAPKAKMQLANVPEDAEGAMSPAAQRAYQMLYPALKTDLQTNGKFLIINDKPTAQIFLFNPDGSLLLHKKVLNGAAVGDFYKGNNDIPANRITPAGLFNLGLRDATPEGLQAQPKEDRGGIERTAGEYDLKKLFVLDKAGGTYSISTMHSVWTHEADGKQRLDALKTSDPANSRYSFGCINVDKDTYKFLIDNHQSKMDGAKLFIVPDQEQVDEFLTGQTAQNKSGRDELTRVVALNPNNGVLESRKAMDTYAKHSIDPEDVPVGDWKGRIVFHGTSDEGADSIHSDGVLVEKSTGGYFGKGFYAATDANLAANNYADFAEENDDEGEGSIIAVKIKDSARILDLRSEKDWEDYQRITKGTSVSNPGFHKVMVRAGIDGLFDRSFGGLVIYNSKAVDVLPDAPISSKTLESRRGKTDDKPSLIITHNLSGANLLHAVRIGGIPVPSLAITDKSNAINSFGEITLLGSKAMADPKGYAKTKSFGGDIYSPRYPTINYKLDANAIKKLNEILAPYQKNGRGIYGSEIQKIDELTQNDAFRAYAMEVTGKKDIWDLSYYEMEPLATEILLKVGAEERLFKGFTNMGNRRYVPHTIETVVKELKKNLRSGEGFNYGVGSIRAKFTQQFRSIADIRKAKDRLIDKDGFERVKDEIDREFGDIQDALTSYHPASDRFGFGDTVSSTMQDAATMGLTRALKENGFDEVPLEQKQAMVEFMNKLRNLPTEYFEAKILRDVDLAEFSGAVVPNDIDPRVIAALKARGITSIKTYDRNNQAERATAVSELADELQSQGKDVLFSKRAKWYRSQLESAIDQVPAKIDNGPGNQWALWLQSNAGKFQVKADELKWSGVLDYLQMQGKNKVSKEQVQDFLLNNNVQVNDVVLGSDLSEIEAWWNDEGGANEEIPFAELNDKQRNDAIAAYEHDVGQFAEGGNNPKFASYKLPGGENYRELKLILPGGEFVSSHFPEDKGLLAHIRFNERTDAEGKKVLFIEEIQSDWGQKGKKEGFAISDIDAKLAEMSKRYGELNDAMAAIPHEATATERELKQYESLAAEQGRLTDEMNKLHDAKRAGIPSAPFVTDTKAWTSLALKRAIAYAVENGFDKVAWTTGEQQAARYDLSKHIDSLDYFVEDNGDWRIIGTKNGQQVVDHTAKDRKGLDELIGKEVAEKIVMGAGEPHKANGVKFNTLSGLDLKVGGEGMKGYYDGILPQVAKKLGAEVGTTDIYLETFVPEDYFVSRSGDLSRWNVFDQNDQTVKSFDTEIEAQDHADELNASNQPGGKSNAQPSFTITDAMREQVAKGLPLFAKSGIQSADGLSGAQSNRTIDANELRDLRREAANLEKPKSGTYLYVTENGEAVASGEKGTKIPTRFIEFAEKHGLKFIARRGTGGNVSRKSNTPMPVEYRESGARYFGDEVQEVLPTKSNQFIDRTGKTRFSQEFRNGIVTGHSVAEIRGALVKAFGEKMIAGLENKGLLGIVASAESLPAGKSISPTGTAFWDGKKAYLIADRMTPAEAHQQLLHEIGEHAGLKVMLGDKGYASLKRQVALMNKAGNKRVQEAYAFVNQNYDYAEGSDNFFHEVLANVGQDADIRAKPWWKEIIATVRRWMTQQGWTMMLKTSDIQDMVLHSLKTAAREDQFAGVGNMVPAMASNRKSTDITTIDRLSRNIETGIGGRPVYLRFTRDAEGDARGRRSANWVNKERESGLSVVALSDDGLGVYIAADDNLPGSDPVNIGGAISNYIDYFDFRGATDAQLVTGEIAGVGSDGEPLLKNVQNIGSVDPEVLFDAYQAWAEAQKDPALLGLVSNKISRLRAIMESKAASPAPTQAVDTESANFRRWFGDSKVVDADDKPIVVYHGTDNDFAKFNLRKLGENTVGNASSDEFEQTAFTGHWFSENPIAGQKHRSGAEYQLYLMDMPVFLKIENPLRLEDNDDLAVRLYGKSGFTLRQELKYRGYDGVIIKRDIEFGGKSYVVFSPTQIKSAISNSGNFSQTNPSILESRQGVISNPALSRALDIADNFTSTQKTFGPMRNVVTQLHKARQDNDFGRVFNLAMNFRTDLSRSAYRAWEQAKDILPAYNDIGSATRALIHGKQASKELARASQWIFDGTTYGGGSPLSGMRWTPEQLRGNFNATDKEIALYEQARNAIDASLTEVANSVAWQIAKPYVGQRLKQEIIDGPDGAPSVLNEALEFAKKSAADEEAIASIDAAIESINNTYDQAEKLKAAGYAPLSRFGKYTVDVFEVDGKGKIAVDSKGVAKRLDFQKFEFESEANAAAKALRKEYAGQSNVVIEQGIQAENSGLFAGVDPETVTLFAEKLADIPGLDIKRTVLDEWRREAVSQRSAIMRNIKRKGIEGYSNDLPRVLANFLTSNARYASSNFHVADMLAAIDDIPKTKGDVRTEADQLYKHINESNEPGAWMRGLMFAWYLGGSPAAAAINLTQPVMMTLPYLSQFGPATKHLASSVKQAMRPALIPVSLHAVMTRAMEEGIVEAQEIHHLYDEGMKPIIARLPGGESLRARAQGAATLWGAFFGMAENFNRRISFLAAYKMAQEMGNGALQAKGFDDAYDFAKRAVEETQGIYAKENRPNWARGTGTFGAVGVAAFTFKQFSIQYVELLTRMYKSGPEGKKSALLMLGLLVLASGLQGLPGADDLDDLLDTILQSLGYRGNVKKAKRDALRKLAGERMADIVMYGLSAETPIDVQARLGLGNLLPATGLFKPSEQNKASQIAEFLGPPGGMAKSVGDLIDATQSGQRGSAFAALSPVFIRNIAKAVQMAESKEYKDSRGRKVTDVDAADAFIKGFGFQPQDVAGTQRTTQMLRQDIAQVKEVESDIAAIWAQGIAESDKDEIARARSLLKDWNEKNPETPIRIKYDQILRRVREMKKEKSLRLLKTAPKELRQYARESIG